MPVSRIAAAFAIPFALGACASLHDSGCDIGEHSAIQDSLYFGTGKPNGAVTREEWAAFLETTVTPRFPQGLSVTEASGQWRGADGAIVREATHLLHLVHPNDAANEQSVAAIVAAYKAQFQQEAVLRVKANACVSF